MKRSLAIGLVAGILAPIGLTSAVSWGASTDTGCWDEYNNRGSRYYRTVAPKGVDLDDCSAGAGCFWGYDARNGSRTRLYVPHGANPQNACDDVTTTTLPPDTTPTTTAATTPTPPTTPPGEPAGRFATLPVGAALPSDSECAASVRPMSENRPENAQQNATKGSGSNDTYPRVTGDFTGTTDEIIQWTACKWGIDEDWVRAQIVNESNWNQSALGDFTTNPQYCSPLHPIGDYPPSFDGDRQHNGECPESIGLGQVRFFYHQSAFEDNNAITSSAYNLDYTYAVWRTCFEGGFGWLNDFEGSGDYAAGDAKGCLGVWFAGRWYTAAAQDYIGRFDQTLSARSWEQAGFPPASPTGSTPVAPIVTTPPSTAAPTTAPPATTPSTTSAPTTVPATAPPTTPAPPTTAATTTVPVTAPPAPPAPPTNGAQFVETFDGDAGLDRFNHGVWHRDPYMVETSQWSGDHSTDCGGPDSQRTVHRNNPDESFYMCKNHLMSSVGDTSGYSVGWFSPDQTFDSVDEVKFDVNLTDLGSRQWWKVGVVSEARYNSTYDGSCCYPAPGFLASDVGAADLPTSLNTNDYFGATWGGGASAGYPGGMMKIGNAKTGSSANPTPKDKATRHPVSLRDNGNGTVTFTVAGVAATSAGSFPDCPCRVVFYDHNYTPSKQDPGSSGPPVGYTWHWDNIIVQ